MKNLENSGSGTSSLSITTKLIAGSSTITNNDDAHLVITVPDADFTIGNLVATAINNEVEYNLAGNQSIIVNDYYYLNLSNVGTKSLAGDITVLDDLIIENDAVLNASGTINLVIYDDVKIENNGNISIPPTNLIFSNTAGAVGELNGTTTNLISLNNVEVNKTLGTDFAFVLDTQLSGNLSVKSETNIEDKDLTVAGTTSITNNAELNKTTDGGNQIFQGQVSIEAGSTFRDISSGSTTLQFEGGIDNSGTVNLKNIVFNSSPQTYFPQLGSSNNIEILEIDEDIIIADGAAVQVTDANLNETLSNQNTTGLTFGNNPTGAGTIINGANAILIYRGASDFFTTGTVDFTDLGNKVIYNRDGSQNILTTTYHHLELKGTGAIDTKQLSGHSILNGDLTVGTNARLDTQTFNLFIGGNFTNNGDFTSTFGEVTFNGTSPQTIGGSSTTSFKGLIINSSGNVDLQTSSEANYINLTNGHLRLNDNDLKLNNTTAVFGGNTSSYIITNGSGQVTRPLSVTSSPCLFPVGNGGYAPITLSIAGASSSNVAVSVENNVINLPVTITDYVNRTWLIHSATTLSNVDVETDWSSADIVGTLDVTQSKIYQYDAGAWNEVGVNGIDLTNNTLDISNVTLQGASDTKYAVFSPIAPGTPPNPPTILYANPITGNSFQANWEKVSNAAFYQIEVSYDNSFSSLFVSDNTTDTLYNITGVNIDDILYVRVQAVNGNGTSAYSTVLTVIITDPRPIMPQNYRAIIVDRQNANLRWDDESFNETGFIIERAIGFDDFEIIDTVYSARNNSEIVYMEEDLSFNQTYFYRVKAFNDFGESDATESIGLIPGSSTVTGNEDLLENSNTLSIYPNPSSGIINIDYISQSVVLPVSIWSTEGKLVWQQTLIYKPDETSINLSHLSAGSYLIIIQDNDNSVSQRIIIKD